MRIFRADIHIHSRFSRATSSKLTAQHLAAWAAVKGLDVLGTGDITHPVWREELKRQLVFDEDSGLYRLKGKVRIDKELPAYSGLNLPAQTCFMLQGEVSSIYKRGGKVRKVHNLVYFPDFEAADKFCHKLGTMGNLNSDGRPIVGLDSRHILELVLESAPDSFMIPAHIWTPWFSLFGSKSGFDSIEECFGDLSGHIFAMETGLSSNQKMNRLISAFDRFNFVSNSDAHSGENLGREANLFSGKLSYAGMLQALRTEPGSRPDPQPTRQSANQSTGQSADQSAVQSAQQSHPQPLPKPGDTSDTAESTATAFAGTVEFFPEEGKYHLDGHRKCNVVMEPAETKARGGICPVCGKLLTIGVLYRVMELADRETPVFPGNTTHYALIPLTQLISEVVGVGTKSRRVSDMHARLIARFGPELSILSEVPTEDITRFSSPLGEAVSRMRHGAVLREGGYDGEYGIVRVFSEKERRELVKRGGVTGLALDGLIMPPQCSDTKNNQKRADGGSAAKAAQQPPDNRIDGPALPKQVDSPKELRFNTSQKRAVCAGVGPTLVLAGPGSGKTRTLIGRILHLLENGVSIRHLLAVTFTRRAATELDQRLGRSLGAGAPIPRTDTLHALAFEVWQRTHLNSLGSPVLLSEESARKLFAEANPSESASRLRDAFDAINLCRERLLPLSAELREYYQRYCQQKASWNLVDYTELIENWREQLDTGNYSRPWTHVLVDEIQDLSSLQLALITALLPPDGVGFFGIGDPDQSIYAFRGAHEGVEGFLRETWPHISVVSLAENYRSAPEILSLASGLMKKYSSSPPLKVAGEEDEAARQGEIRLFEAPSAESEAVWIASQMRSILGSTSHTLQDNQKSVGNSRLLGSGEYSLGDIAVLVRTRALIAPIEKALQRSGIPCTVPQAEAFWFEPRVELILAAAGRMLGLSVSNDALPNCPERILSKGPLSLAAFYSQTPPFDALFWQSGAFKSLARAFDLHGGWRGLINWLSLQNELELVKNQSEKVQIMTLHASKGLEFKVVFLPGLEDGLLPFMGPDFLTGRLKSGGPGMNLAEERRLLYVGITRAQDAVFLSLSARRGFMGRELRLKPSRFIKELPEANIIRSTLKAHHSTKETQLKLLS